MGYKKNISHYKIVSLNCNINLVTKMYLSEKSSWHNNNMHSMHCIYQINLILWIMIVLKNASHIWKLNCLNVIVKLIICYSYYNSNTLHFTVGMYKLCSS